MKILITGASGFIGLHLVKYCLEQGHAVMAIDKDEQGLQQLIRSIQGGKLERSVLLWRNLNIASQPNTMEHECFEIFKPDVCYHLAAYASEGRSNHIRSFIHYNNTVGTANVINACVNHQCKLVFTSSVAVYSGSPPFTEAMTPNPIDEYGLSKYMSERSIQIAGETQGLDWCIIRPRNVYGPGQNMWDRSRNLFGIWMYNALHDLPCLIFNGTNIRTFTYIDDIIPPLYKAKDVSRETINLGSVIELTSIDKAANIFQKVTGYYKFENTTPRHEVAEAFCSAIKSKQLLEFKDKTSLEEGLKKMWAWAKEQPERPLQQMPPLECTQNAHSSLT